MLTLKKYAQKNEIKRKQKKLSSLECTITDLYNALQQFFGFMSPKFLLFDIRSIEEFKVSHVISAVHVDCSKLFYKNLHIESIKFQHLSSSKPMKDSFLRNKEIWIYHGGAHHAHGNEEKSNDDFIEIEKVIQNLQNILEGTAEIRSFNAVKAPFSAFKRKYPFLCSSDVGNNDANMIINPEDLPNEIIENKLFLGDFNHAKSWDAIKDLKITHIINVTANIPNHFKEHGVKYLNVKVDDNNFAQIEEYFEQSNKFIDDAAKEDKNRVLVHCQMGVSRSATITIAYVMYKNQCSFDDAFELVKKCRKCVCPNESFEKQLREYEKRIVPTKENKL